MKNKIALVGILAIVLAVLAVSSAVALPIPPGKEVIVWFEPDPSSGPYGEDVTVQLRMNSSIPLWGWATHLYFEPSCVNITNADYSAGPFTSETGFTWWGNYVIIAGSDPDMCEPAGEHLMVTLTLQCNCTSACISQLYHNPTNIETLDCDIEDRPALWVNGNFTCEAPEETFTKPLEPGWNLISLPLTPSNNSTAKVLETVPNDAVFRYNANLKAWEGVSTMDPGIGYFVNVTAPTGSMWTYNGTAYTSMNVSIEKGLNMVGWLNCSMNVSDALSSLDGKYNYAARFNATSQRFEAYEPHAPSVFNDFTTMDRGTGYFISARAGCPRLDKSCPL